jgi:hypothetical protein
MVLVPDSNTTAPVGQFERFLQESIFLKGVSPKTKLYPSVNDERTNWSVRIKKPWNRQAQ